jgi:transcriptional regulator with AAA-type ATPase domain
LTYILCSRVTPRCVDEELIMTLFSAGERSLAKTLAGIAFGNPFAPKRIDQEREMLGPEFVDNGPVIVIRSGASYDALFPNVSKLHRRAESLTESAQQRLRSGYGPTEDEQSVYEDVACYVLYNRHVSLFNNPIRKAMEARGWAGPVGVWPRFRADFDSFFAIPDRALLTRHRPEHLFAAFFQVARAFHAIFENIVGSSKATARLREAVWQSIFTQDMRRYIRTLYPHMANITTLITGPSGTGKELVAQAIGRSRYLAFDHGKKRFAESHYTALNLSAFVPTLLESELFGHVKGAFNGALERKGWLEQCSGRDDTVFLDEIGELDEAIQVKLLRVLQERCFARVGETTDEPPKFHGKIIAATNRDLATAMRAGKFREDFYHRLCDDHIVTPSLAEQLADRPEDLMEMVRFLLNRILGEPTMDPDSTTDAGRCAREADALTTETVDWIEANLKDYRWPGNFRELSRCVRNVMIRGSYRPPLSPRGRVGGLGPVDELLHNIRKAKLTADKLCGCYYALAYSRSGESWTAAGRRLGVDWRTVRDGHDPAFLEKLRRARAVQER